MTLSWSSDEARNAANQAARGSAQDFESLMRWLIEGNALPPASVAEIIAGSIADKTLTPGPFISALPDIIENHAASASSIALGAATQEIVTPAELHPVIEPQFTVNSKDAGATVNLTNFEYVRVNRWSNSSAYCPAIYEKVVSEPSHTAKWQDSEGNWFELRENHIYAEMFGLKAGASAASNTTALQNAIAFAAASIGSISRRTVRIGAGEFDFNGPIVNTSNYVKIWGSGPFATILYNNETDQSGFIFRPSDPTALPAGNPLQECGLRDMSISRRDSNATAGYGLEVVRADKFRCSGLRITSHANGIHLMGGQDSFYYDLAVFGRFSGDPIAGTSCFHSEAAPLSDGSYQNIWQTFVTNFIFGGAMRVEDTINIEGSDGLNFSQGYVNFGTRSLVRLSPTNQGIGPLSFTNTYFDGVNPTDGGSYVLYVPSYGGSHAISEVNFGSGSRLCNSATTIGYIRGSCNLYFTGAGISGWPVTSIAPNLFDVDHASAQLVFTGCRLTQARGGITITNGSLLMLTGCRFENIVGSGNYCVNLVTAVSNAIVTGTRFAGVSNAFDWNDTATGNRRFGGGNSSLNGHVSAPMGIQLQNNNISDVNVLDRYLEQVSWTPSLTFAGSSSGVTFTEEHDVTRVGNIIQYAARFAFSSRGTHNSTDDFRISLPVSAKTGTGSLSYPQGAPRMTSVPTATAAKIWVSEVIGSEIRILTIDTGTGDQVSMKYDDLDDDSVIAVSGSYTTV
jgi:hypothetical protein